VSEPARLVIAPSPFREAVWEINCQVCGRSSWDGRPDNEDGDRCRFCGQLPEAKEDLDSGGRA